MIVPEDQTGLRRLGGRVARQLRWARRVGVSRLVEEDQLDPRERALVAWRRWWWQVRSGAARGSATPVYLVGMQRSGTNMLSRGLQVSPDVMIYNENDWRAFRDYRLRSDDRIAKLVRRSRARYVVFKPLCDSHNVTRLLDALPVAKAGRALWVYRNVDGRARSAMAKFGDVNRRVLREIAAVEGSERWQAQRLSPRSLELIRRYDYDSMTGETAAALFWYVRNSLFFELGLDQRADVMLCSYDLMVADGDAQGAAIGQFLGLPSSEGLLRHTDARSASQPGQLPLDRTVRALCDDLTARLDAVAAGVTGR